MALESYRRKRDPARTPEPFGGSFRGSRFVVQRHSARRLHYDLRLERGGVLLSWAVPKGLPTEQGARRRAIHTEDHPLEYVDFHGVIPAGQYGAGVMDIYDGGTYELLEESAGGSLTFRLDGGRLHGVWTLAPAHLEGDERNWLLIRRDGSRRLARELEPMLPVHADVLPRGQWSYEVAWGGLRTLARLHEGDVTFPGDRDDRFASIGKRLGRALRVFDCVVDGEICALDRQGRPSRALLRREEAALTYFLFDLLELEGESQLSRPLAERRQLLQTLLDPTERTVRFSEPFDDGPQLLATVEAERLPGVLAKRNASVYVPGGRSGDWVEVRAGRRAPPRADEPEPGQVELRRNKRRIRLTRLEYLWWPDSGIRKADLVDYYRQVSPVLLPHLRRRPFTLKRHLNGPKSPFEWIKDAPDELPAWIPRCPLPAKSRGGASVEYPLVDDELALLWMVDYGCIDLHLWYSRCDRPGRPDFVLFDLDPARVGFAAVVEAARLLHELLSLIGLTSFVRTTGGEGLHVLVPVARRYTYADTRGFAELVADALVRARPDLVTTERSLERRRGVFVDTKMNGEGMTIASAYSVRPLPGPPVATPLAWDELGPELVPARFSMQRVLERVAEHGDLHAPLLSTRQRLEPALARVRS